MTGRRHHWQRNLLLLILLVVAVCHESVALHRPHGYDTRKQTVRLLDFRGGGASTSTTSAASIDRTPASSLNIHLMKHIAHTLYENLEAFWKNLSIQEKSAGVASAAVELTPDNFEEMTAGKTVFIKFLAPW